MVTTRLRRTGALIASAALFASLTVATVAAPATAGPDNDNKLSICHATRDIENPYVAISVSLDAIDGDLGNDRGRGDHYATHTGPVFDPAVHTQSGMVWGDIIPPIPGVHLGLNWGVVGQAISNNGCNLGLPG